MTIQVSVVVPTFRRPDLLRRCLAALLNQWYAPDAYEIIVVDDAADPAIAKLVATTAASVRTRLHYLAGNRCGPAAARNAGWRAACGTIIAFTDDDCIPQLSWLACGTAAFVDDVAGASGRVIVPLPNDPTDYERDCAGLERSEFVTASCFYRRDALEEAGGFDERFTAPWREDSDLFFTLLEQKRRLVYAPAATVLHPTRPAAWGVSLCQQRKSMFNALLYKKHPALYRQRLAPLTPWHYYAILSALFSSFACLLAGHRRGAVSAAAVWLLLTGRFCQRRLAQTSAAPSHVAEMLLTSVLIPPLSVFWRLYGAVKFRVLFL